MKNKNLVVYHWTMVGSCTHPQAHCKFVQIIENNARRNNKLVSWPHAALCTPNNPFILFALTFGLSCKLSAYANCKAGFTFEQLSFANFDVVVDYFFLFE